MKWPRKYIYIAGGILILLTNIVALGGVAWNRKGDPRTVMKLSERELYLPYNSQREFNENSGIALHLRWQSAEGWGRQGPYKEIHKSGDPCEPGWLDQEKLKSLGFDVSQPAGTPEGKRHYDKELPREAFLVLEFNGPAYVRAVEAARKKLADQEALLKGYSSGKWGSVTGVQDEVKYLKRELEDIEQSETRLFVVDAGLNAQTLRTRYPDIAKYAIVHGEVKPGYFVCGEKNNVTVIRGSVQELSITEINVPFRYRHQFEPLRRMFASGSLDEEKKGRAHPYEVTLVYGQHLEPWIKEVSWKNNPPAGK